MDAIQALVGRRPQDAARIRLLYWRNPEFRTVCDDHRDALAFATRLDAAQPRDAERADEYRQLADELLAEAIQMLKESGLD